MKIYKSDNSQTLPVPATYIIDIDGKIIWRQFNRDYKIRSKVEDIMDQL